MLSLEKILEENVNTLWTLTAWGQGSGSLAQYWIAAFKEVGALHLLVLSGSQIGHLKTACERFFQGFKLLIWGPRPMTSYPLEELSLLLLSYYVALVEFPPPITRAYLLVLSHYLFQGRGLFFSILGAFLLQILLFGHHLESLGFYLSWASFLLLLCVESLRLSKPLQIFILSCLCQALVVFLKGQDWPSILDWLKILIANAILISLFEYLWMPICSWVILFVLLGLGERFFGVFGGLMESVAKSVLVVVEGFGYI